MVRNFFALVLSLSIVHQGFAETWIKANNHTVEIKKGTNCKATMGDDWKEVCDCCLIKNTRVKHQSEVNAISACARKYNCNFKERSRKNMDLAKKEVARAAESLKAMSIYDLEAMENPPFIPKSGLLEPRHVNGILHSLNEAGYISLPKELFGEMGDSSERLRIKPLGDTAKGFFTGQLFTVRYDAFYLDQAAEPAKNYKILYILKETKKGVKEIRNLYRVGSSRINQEHHPISEWFDAPEQHEQDRIARIAFDEIHFRFKTHGRTRYFSLLQTAPGLSLHHHLEKFGEDLLFSSTEEIGVKIDQMKTAFYDVGFGLSKLHQRYSVAKHGSLLGRTFTHGDLHSENIFYDFDSRQVTLIDNETFALSLNRPWSGVNDLAELYLLHTVHTIAHAVSKQLTTNLEFGIDDELWHKLWTELLIGYIDAYGDLTREDYVRVYDEVHTEFFNALSQTRIFKSPRYFNDQRKLKRFLPTLRRWRIKHFELRDTFMRVQERGLKKYELPISKISDK